MIGKLCYRRLEKDKKYTPIWAGSKLSILVETDYWILNNEFNIQKVIRNYAETSIIEHLEFIKSISSEKGRCFIDIFNNLNLDRIRLTSKYQMVGEFNYILLTLSFL